MYTTPKKSARKNKNENFLTGTRGVRAQKFIFFMSDEQETSVDADQVMETEEETDSKIMTDSEVRRVQPRIEQFYEDYPFYPKPAYMDKMRARLTKYLDPNAKSKPKPISKEARDPKNFFEHFEQHVKTAPLCKKAHELGTQVVHGAEMPVERDSQDKMAVNFFTAYDDFQKKIKNKKQPTANALMKAAKKLIARAEAILNKASVAAKRQPPKRKREEKEEELVEVQAPPAKQIVFDDQARAPSMSGIEAGFDKICAVLEETNRLLREAVKSLNATTVAHGWQTRVIQLKDSSGGQVVTSNELFPTKEAAEEHIRKRFPQGVKWSEIIYK